jgi:hypothetical protein
MPSVNDIYSKVRSGKLTASDCVELFGESTETVHEDRPPHAHAHISKEGFRFGESTDLAALREELIWLRARLNNKYTTKPPQYEEWKKSFPKVQQAILKLEQNRDIGNTEGAHLDPVLMKKMIPHKYQLEPGRGTGHGLPDYTTRAVHSQFEDSESAIMALFYSLTSNGGKTALYELTSGWFFNSSWNRMTIHSLTAANGLNEGPIAPAGNGSAPSAHPLRGQDIGMVERGPGSAGNATLTSATIGRVTTVFDRIGAGQLRIVTHYPTVTRTANGFDAAKANTHDFVQFVNFASRMRESKDYPATAPATMKW